MQSSLPLVTKNLLFLVLVTIVLYFGRPVLVPLFYAILFAMLMSPLCRNLNRRGWKRIPAALVCVLVLLLTLLGIMAIFVVQVSSFIGNISQIEESTNELILEVNKYVEQNFDIPVEEQTKFLQRETSRIGSSIREYLSGIVKSSVQTLVSMIFILVFTFLFLLHREKYRKFFLQAAGGNSLDDRKTMLNRISDVAQHYLVGRAISILFLFVLYLLALLIIGINNALLLAAVAALFNIIPYLGPILAAVVPVLVALVTEGTIQPALWVLITFCLFQAIDNYWVTPYFLGGEVSLSALSTILAMICGGYLWGVSGMILFIPLISMAKIVLDQIPPLRHYGELIGDTGSRPSQHMRQWIQNLFTRRKT